MTVFKYKKVDPSVLKHAVESRGFVTVPFDYENKDGEKISIFYRLIPAYGSKPDDASKPVIVVINGGPGISCSAYRALDFDYQNPDAPQNGPVNRFQYLLKTHRVLIVDQRGTDGQSVPLDMDDPNLDANGIARYFSSDSQARDYAAVIDEVIPKNEQFLMIAQSYGGMVGMQYLSRPELRKPKGLIFSCSALPYEDMRRAMLSRRQEQLKLNHELKNAIPDIEMQLNRGRAYLRTLNLDPNHLNNLYTYLGKGVKGAWEQGFVKHLESLLTKTKAELEIEFKSSFGSGSLLNYILSSANFTPGQTDRTIAHETSKEIPFEPWMLDENWVLLQTGEGSKELAAIVDRMDASPPPPTAFASVDAIRSEILKNRVLFTPADNDAYVPAETYEHEIKKFEVPGHTEIKRLPGGHNAIFLESGHATLLTWSETL